MKAALLRTGSVPAMPGSPRVSLRRHDSVAGVFSGERNSSSSKISLHLHMNGRGDVHAPIRRALSENEIIRSSSGVSGGTRSFPAGIPEEEHVFDGAVDDFLPLMKNGNGRTNYAPVWTEYGIPLEEVGFSGDGISKGGRPGDNRGRSGDGNEDKSKIGDYYREMLKLNPGDSLLLRNYGKFLYEVEKDVEKAEECYGRAILASPGDGEVLSLYAKLIWETERDESRAKSYYDRAVYSSPDDCMVLGSYAHFMWEAEEDEDDDEEEKAKVGPTMVAVF